MASELCCMPSSYFLTKKLTTSIPPIPRLRRTPSTTPSLSIRCSATTQGTNLTADRRTSANFQPSSWSYDFVQSLNNEHLVEEYKEKVKELEEEVRRMINNENVALLNKLELVDEIQRFGLAHRFGDDIRRAVDKIYNFNVRPDQECLHAAALRFRLLRQHGYHVSPDIFKSFKDENGNFKESFGKDVKGLLSLYEASHLAFEGEDLLDEAKEFTRMHLKNLDANHILAEQVNHALELPLHHRMLKLEARWSIEAYSKRFDANQALLELAKLDFNMVQSTLQRELKDMSRWWKALELASKLSFTRDRLMESFFWALGMVCEPQLGNLRKGLTKVIALITVIDDVYDAYGTPEELELFTSSVERWDVNAVQILPDYMKLCFLALYNTVNEMVYETLKAKGENVLPYLTKAWSDLCKAFLKEAKWSKSKYSPTFEEYLENAWISASGVVLLVHAYFLSFENITQETLECLENHHNLLRWPSIIFRLSNDLATSTAEIQRGETANSISCSMRDNNVSEECARKYLQAMIEDSWKKMNMEMVDGDSPFPKQNVDTAINLARIAQCTYQYGDGHGTPDTRSKNRVLSLIINPID
ncbi:tricyclene synthase EBOS, chloroplastic [Ziziphus jujuba]|uniref:Tricyclene synthase EBOS, chloroplastic n=1 Tax=Ziziphus jujuba TaxID=326968 RepID=A0ABM3IHC6_ZIZJJ|nr:tricyclene synthase EBOS, chloroplastic [Ziziphus jujuba]